MLLSNLQMAIRRLRKDRFFQALNIASLSLGLAAVWVIATYLHYELSFDKFHDSVDRIYRVTEAYEDDARFMHSAKSHGPMADVLMGRLPGLQNLTRILPHDAYLQAPPLEKFRDTELIFADSSFFSIFSFSLIAGAGQPFHSPFSIALTESAAIRYFGTADVVGRAMRYEDERTTQTYYVTAVLKDIPQNSHFHFSAVLNMASLEQIMPWYNNWHHPPLYIYLKMEAPAEPQSLGATLQRLADIHQPDHVREQQRRYTAQPLSSIHLHSSLYDEWEANSHISYVRLFAGVCFFLVLVACINFVNLSTAQAARRAKEIGVRKVMGAMRRQLTIQLLVETFTLTSISLLVALGLAELLMATAFSRFFDLHLSLGFLLEGWNLASLLVLLLFITFLAGAYPAFFLAGFKAVVTLKGKVGETGSLLGFRRSLVLFQFLVTGFLIMGTIVVMRQSDLLRNKHLGFEKEALVAVRMVDRFANSNYLSFKEALLKDSRIINAAVSSEVPGGNSFHGFEVNPEEHERQRLDMKTLGMDEDFINTYGLTLIAGRNFSKEIATDDQEAVILNEAAASLLAWAPDEAIGKDFELVLYIDKEVVRKGKVIGVVKDFNFESLYHHVEPLVLYQNKHPYYCDYLTLKVAPGDLSQSLAAIKSTWNLFRPEKPIEFFFIDDRLDQMYSQELKISSILGGFSSLSVFISALGLFGLAAHSAQRRTREISIRKVLGASAGQLLALLSREYLYLVFIANILAWPLAALACQKWLQNFPYQVSFGIDIAVVTMAFTLVMALSTTAMQCMKTAMANPAETLKTE